ncbi:argininosuccinate lyase [Pseudomonas thivervalensis]|uniref:Argininosuccinate lyase n=1 Tax=Pseudomonas thivervalensis TaxID=86265 RepID=A0A176NEE0_9PSED|nr:argininosuccinate lyase [Pseudomonas thivervalensis]AXA54259.1 argininosuccinate lyase [Pseudomonas thivervalensis]AXA59939.1 argininosuccinate lyase [Pseudomonas thivervalensis]OAB49484.1 argininosuccinate lyase [Pseudomonas thivervalensis]SDF71834.1 argininosuccinate lyase [Pseudomonas thivervalensis]
MQASKVSRRLKEATAPEVNEYIYRPRLQGFAEGFDLLGNINKAHIVMLAEQGLIRDEHAAVLARGVLKMEEAGPGEVTLDPSREDAYFNYEAHLIGQIGTDIGGRLHTGRSRNDILATLDRLRCREVLMDLIDALLEVRQTAVNNAEVFADVVMPGYTHLQPAQPITYGYYLSAVEQALARDCKRLTQTLESMNQSPLGAAAFAGTPFNIDRGRTAELLGFDGYLDNALDAVGSRDFMLESLSHLSLLAVFWSRVAQDYFVWSTHEFSLIDFPDSVAATSSIMPQKKNPTVLEYLKGRSGHIVGLLMGASISIKGSNFSHTGDGNREGTRGFWEAAEESLRCLKLLDLVLRTATPNIELAVRRAGEDFSTATGLADLIVQEADLSFREAHHVVGGVVRKAMDAGLLAHQIDTVMIDACALEQLGYPLNLPARKVRDCLDPTANVQARISAGGPSMASLKPSLLRANTRIATERHANQARRDRLAAAQERLQAATRAQAGL